MKGELRFFQRSNMREMMHTLNMLEKNPKTALDIMKAVKLDEKIIGKNVGMHTRRDTVIPNCLLNLVKMAPSENHK